MLFGGKGVEVESQNITEENVFHFQSMLLIYISAFEN
jgi:hypothetical protein